MSQCDNCKFFSSMKVNKVINSCTCPVPENADGTRGNIFDYWNKAQENKCELFIEKTDEEKKIRDEAYRKQSGPKLY